MNGARQGGTMRTDALRGILRWRGPARSTVVLAGGGERRTGVLWPGYARFAGTRVLVRPLPVHDAGKPVLLVAPLGDAPPARSVELYLAERLPRHAMSRFGHVAAWAGGHVFNYSRTWRENEALDWAEFAWRPPLGDYGPERHDYFGRRFMRTLHVLRIDGLDTVRVRASLQAVRERILARPPDPRDPEYAPWVNLAGRNCVALLRLALVEAGLPVFHGLTPRAFFVDAAWRLRRLAGRGVLRLSYRRLPQVVVPECAPSLPASSWSPRTAQRERRLAREGFFGADGGLDRGPQAPGRPGRI